MGSYPFKSANLSLPPLDIQSTQQFDRRSVSWRWFFAILLIGLTACSLMGAALRVASNGSQTSSPPFFSSYEVLLAHGKGAENQKNSRIKPTLAKQRLFQKSKEFELPALEHDKYKKVPPAKLRVLHLMLAERPSKNFTYPKFNALNIFADTPEGSKSNAVSLLAQNPQREEPALYIRISPLNLSTENFSESDEVNKYEAEAALLAHASIFSSTLSQFCVPYAPKPSDKHAKVLHQTDLKISPENLTILTKPATTEATEDYTEDLIPIHQEQTIADTLQAANYDTQEASAIAATFTKLRNSPLLPAGSTLRVGAQIDKNSTPHLVRISLYEGEKHIISIAYDDSGKFTQSEEPERTSFLDASLRGGVAIPHLLHSNLPRIYDAIYRTGLSNNLPEPIIRTVLRIVAGDIDLESTVSLEDTIDVLYPEKTAKNEASPVLYVKATFNNHEFRYYRFQAHNTQVDYYNEEGHSAKQFLIRKPVPNGIFSSPFGSRRHPILGYVRMHTGVDWAAPIGSPIIAAGDGIVTKVGYMNGYGNHTEIQHANGYMTSYSHQSRFAASLHPKMHVKQGQIIGFVGSTGLSTGAHCHFEVVVNGTKVDPMRVKIPDSHLLSGADLKAFNAQKNRLNALLLRQIGSM